MFCGSYACGSQVHIILGQLVSERAHAHRIMGGTSAFRCTCGFASLSTVAQDVMHISVGWVLSVYRPLPVILPVLILNALMQGRGMKGPGVEGGQVGMLGSGFCLLFSQKWMAWSLPQVLV